MSRRTQIPEYEHETIPGLPGDLPDGERILWQGSPSFAALTRRAFHVWKLGAYFAALLGFALVGSLVDGQPLADGLASTARFAVLALGALGVLTFIAWLNSRATVYTLTDQRVVLRYGVALSMAVNLPFKQIESADLQLHEDGTGDISLTIGESEKLGYLLLWPYARPWHFGQRTQPMLRAISRADETGRLFATALRAKTEDTRAAAAPTALPDFEAA